MNRAWAWTVLLLATGALGADGGADVPDAGAPETRPDAGALGEWPDSDASTDVVDTLLKAGEFTGLLKCIAEADLAELLKGPGPYTVLAPTDAAFAKLKKELPKLLADKEKLRRVVLYHVMPGRVSAAELRKLKNGDRLPTLLEGKKIKLSVKKDGVHLDRAALVKKDLDASNGMVQAIDTVLVP